MWHGKEFNLGLLTFSLSESFFERKLFHRLRCFIGRKISEIKTQVFQLITRLDFWYSQCIIKNTSMNTTYVVMQLGSAVTEWIIHARRFYLHVRPRFIESCTLRPTFGLWRKISMNVECVFFVSSSVFRVAERLFVNHYYFFIFRLENNLFTLLHDVLTKSVVSILQCAIDTPISIIKKQQFYKTQYPPLPIIMLFNLSYQSYRNRFSQRRVIEECFIS